MLKYHDFVVRNVVSLFDRLLGLPIISGVIMNLIDKWSDAQKYHGIRYFIAGSIVLQTRCAEVSGGKLCEECEWYVKPNETHPQCVASAKAKTLSQEDLLRLWSHFPLFEPGAEYAEIPGLSMEDWYRVIDSEVTRRGLYWWDDPEIVVDVDKALDALQN